MPRLLRSFLTVSCLGFLSAGVAAGSVTLLRMHRWLRVIGAAIDAGIGAFVLCAITRWAGWFPIGAEGWELVFDPIARFILAAPVAFLLSAALETLTPRPPA